MSYPAPEVPYQGTSDLYFATEAQVRSNLWLANFDRGVLAREPGRVVFTGMSTLVDCPGVTAIGLVRKAFPWGITIVAVAAGVAAFAVSSPGPMVWRNPFAYLLGLILAMSLYRQAREEWVEVTYEPVAGAGVRRVYFRRNPIWFGSAARATRALHDELRAVVLPPRREAADAPT